MTVKSNETLDYIIDSMQKQSDKEWIQNAKEHWKLFRAVESLWDTMQAFIHSADEKYASKSRVNGLESRMNKKEESRANVRIEFIKTRWAIIVAVIWFAWLYIAS